MAKSTVLVPISKSFERRVQKLAQEGSEIVEFYAELTSRMLTFAADFKAATDEAARNSIRERKVFTQSIFMKR